MNRSLPLLGAALGIAAALLTATPATAQVRVGVRVGGVRRAPVVVRPYYYRPYYYDSWYWYPEFYGLYQYPPYPPYAYGRYDNSSSLRLDVKPKETQVFIDGYYAGTADDFDGFFQRLNLEPGEHELQLYLPGYRVQRQRVYLQPDRTFKVRYTMVPLAPGEAEPPRPTPATAPAPPPPPDQGVRGPQFPGPREQPRDREPRRLPPPQSGTRESSYGTLALRVQPGDAEITIDGERWESSGNDRLLVQLSTGTHHVEARKDGYRVYATDVTVRPGDTATLNVALSRQP